MSIPHFNDVRDGDRITIVGTVSPNTSTILHVVISEQEYIELNADEYAACVVKVERATWNEVTA